MSPTSVRRRDLVLGALVADAAALGLHWLYDPAALAARAPADAECAFLAPAPYPAGSGAFAHAGKRPGDPSPYGVHLRVLLEALCAADGALDLADYQARFRAAFGYGGRFCGYIDKPTRGTLANLDAGRTTPSGVDDDQVCVLAKLPALLAADLREAATLDAAVRVTHTADAALAWCRFSAGLLAALVDGATLADALAAALAQAPAALATAARQGLECTAADPAAALGRACPLAQAMPLALHLLAHAPDFAGGVRANIRAGGDSCGRALLLGPALAALHGVGTPRGIPLAWLARLVDAPALIALAETLAAR